MPILNRLLTRKNILILLAVILIAGGFLYQRYYYSELLEGESEFNIEKQFEIEKLKRENGNLAFITKQQQVTTKTLERQLKTGNKQLQSLEKRIGSLSNLVASIDASIEITDTIQTTLTDTLIKETTSDTAKVFNHSDQFASIKGVMISNVVDLSYKVSTDLSIVSHWEKNGLFKPKTLNLDVESTNPNLEFTALKGFTIEEPPKKWFQTKFFQISVGIAVGVATGYIIAK